MTPLLYGHGLCPRYRRPDLTFGVSGKLVMNTLIMYDHQTDSLWSQFLSTAIRGDLRGTELELLPALMTDWQTWAELHPDTLVLEKSRSGSRDSYARYYESPDAGVLGETRTDDRLYTKEYVVGLVHNNVTRAYPFSVLNDSPVVNDTVGDDPVLVTFDASSGAGVVFNRIVDGQTLTFEPIDAEADASDATLYIQDEGTKTRWCALAGEAVEGELSGSTLQQIPTTLSFWFGWKDFYPETEIYQPN